MLELFYELFFPPPILPLIFAYFDAFSDKIYQENEESGKGAVDAGGEKEINHDEVPQLFVCFSLAEFLLNEENYSLVRSKYPPLHKSSLMFSFTFIL